MQLATHKQVTDIAMFAGHWRTPHQVNASDDLAGEVLQHVGLVQWYAVDRIATSNPPNPDREDRDVGGIHSGDP